MAEPSDKLKAAAASLTKRLKAYDWFVRVDPVALELAEPDGQQRLDVMCTPTAAFIDNFETATAITWWDSFMVSYRGRTKPQKSQTEGYFDLIRGRE